MEGFLGLCKAFIGGCAEFFNLPFPGLGIPIYTVFIAFLAVDVIISTISVVFGVRSEGDSDVKVRKR